MALGDGSFTYTFQSFSPFLKILLALVFLAFIVINITFFRLAEVLSRERPSKSNPDASARRPPPSPEHPTHLLVVLGSGGHTAEMLNMLQQQLPTLAKRFTYRTYVVSSGDSFSAVKAAQFEAELASHSSGSVSSTTASDPSANYQIATIHRARRVHQSLLTTPFTTLLCLRDSLRVLRGTHADQLAHLQATASGANKASYPDLILTNGPGTGVCIVLASVILLFFGMSGYTASQTSSSSSSSSKSSFTDSGQMRTIYIESWARVKTLSLSAVILKPFVDRFVVQWPGLAGIKDEDEDEDAEAKEKKKKEKEGKQAGGRTEYVGPLVR